MEFSPYNSMMNNPIMFIDPDGRAAMAPIYDTGGNFLGTDDQGLQGKAIVMDKKDFKQGMSHDKAMSKSKGAKGLDSKEAGSKLLNHFDGLKDRPDYDGFVTISEGVDWARDNVGALDNPTPVNLFSKNNLLNSGLNSKLRGTVYALGPVNMVLTDRTWAKIKIANDFNLQNASKRATDYDWNHGGASLMRRTAIDIERKRTGFNNSHGFRAYYHGTGTIKFAPPKRK